MNNKLIDKPNKSEEDMDNSKRAVEYELDTKIKSMQDIVRWIDSRDTRELNEGIMLNETEAKFIANMLREYLKLLNDHRWQEILEAFSRIKNKERFRQQVRNDTFKAFRLL